MICFDEVRRCYLDGSDMAVVLLCLAYVERELAAGLYAAGWKDAKSADWERCWKRPTKAEYCPSSSGGRTAIWPVCGTRTPTSARPGVRRR